MKNLLTTLILILTSLTVQAQQLQIVQTEASYFYVTHQDDTVSQHSTIRKAIESATDILQLWPQDTVLITRNREIRVFQEIDEPVYNTYWTSSETSLEYRLNISYETTADSSTIIATCINSEGESTFLATPEATDKVSHSFSFAPPCPVSAFKINALISGAWKHYYEIVRWQ